MDRGDPRGPVIATQANGCDHRPWIAENERALLGPFADRYAPYVTIDWHLGHWHRLAIHWLFARAEREGISIAQMITDAFRFESARFLNTLSVTTSDWPDPSTRFYQELIDVLAVLKPDLHEFEIGWSIEEQIPRGRCAIGALWEALPDLRTLRICCRELELGCARSRQLRTLALDVQSLTALDSAHLPELREFEYRARNRAGEGALLDGLTTRFPALRVLKFHGDLQTILQRTQLLEKLDVLWVDLPPGANIPTRELLESRDALAHLREIVIRGDHIYGEEAALGIPNLRLTK